MRHTTCAFTALLVTAVACGTELQLGDLALLQLRAEVSAVAVSPSDTLRVRVVATNPQGLALEYTTACPLPGVSFRVYDAEGEVREGLRVCIPEDGAVRHRVEPQDSLVITGLWTPLHMQALNYYVPRPPGPYAVVPTLEAVETLRFGQPVPFNVTP
jgi:hypothetical protein